MDQDLEQLARNAASDPTDEAAARRYDTALARGGRPDEVRRRFRMKFECPLQWTDFKRTGTPGIKFCESCQREVHAVEDEESLREKVDKGHCVSFPTAKLAHVFSGLATDARFHSASEETTPCVVPGGKVPDEIPTAALRIPLSRAMARNLGAVPIGFHEKTLVVAVTSEHAQFLEDVRFLSGREVKTTLVTEDDFEKLVAKLPERARGHMTTGVVT